MVLFRRQRHPKAVVHRCSIKKVFRKISETSVERLVIGILFHQVAGLEPGPPKQNNFQREDELKGGGGGWEGRGLIKIKTVVSNLPILVSPRGTTMVFTGEKFLKIRVLDWLKLAPNHPSFFKIFSNFVHFCLSFQIFCPFCSFF